MKGNVTKNGVKIVFENNFISMKDGAPPLLVFDDNNLIEINFDGYEIRSLSEMEISEHMREIGLNNKANGDG